MSAMTYQIDHRSRDGHQFLIHETRSLDDAVGYICAIAAPDLNRRNVRHMMTHPSFRTKSFTASSPGGGMFHLHEKDFHVYAI